MSRRFLAQQTRSLYSKLPINSSTARLVTILPPESRRSSLQRGVVSSGAALPNGSSQFLVCEIDEFDVNDVATPYKALSYSWEDGDDQGTVYIMCNATAVQVSTHLYKALVRLRSDTEPVKVWVDSLCINQKDNSERTHQVKIMREIYQHSSEVIVWLGDSKEHDNLLPTCTRSLLDIDYLFDWCGDKRDFSKLEAYYDPDSARLRRFYFDDFTRDIFGALCMVHALAAGIFAFQIPAFRNLEEAAPIMRGFEAIAGKSWWERVWVVQEVVVAERVTVMYGKTSVPWEMLCKAADQLNRSQQNCHLDSMYPYLRKGQALADFARLVTDIESTRKIWRSRTPLVLLQLLRKFRSRKASDPKDKVFALLGLVQFWAGHQPMHADYNHSIESTFLGTMMMLISSMKSLSVLAGSTGRSYLRASRAPSWVIDWGFPAEANEYTRLKSIILYSAGGGLQGNVRLHGGGILESPAYWVGKVATLGEELVVEAATRMRGTVSSWEKLLLAYVLDSSLRGLSRAEDFWRTLIGDVEYVLEDGQPIQEGDDGADEFHRASSDAQLGWRFFITEEGRIGIGPKDMRVGDDVAILCGSQVPFVLRQSPRKPRPCQNAMPETLFTKNQQQQYISAGRDANEELLQTLKGDDARVCNRVHWPCYTVVGDAYVHGVMDEAQNSGREQSTVYLV
ncbi:uncharacterized protein PG998_002839 [Apiospora kogelbergensis]|uniref:uncharacterized protein n=1 Tax=Apiospora kogelbergensis TaxID=1337665 RepID=UPI00312CDB00